MACAIFFAIPNASNGQDWGQVQKLLAQYPNGNSAVSANSYYGQSMSVSGNYAVLGATDDGYDASGGNYQQMAGSVYVLFNDAGVWKTVAKLTSPVRSSYARFGASVAIDGDYLVVGETGAMINGQSQGVAHIYKRDAGGTWTFTKRIQARTVNPGDSFAEVVDISGDYIVVGARNDDFDTNDANFVDNAGAVYVYEKNAGGSENWGLVKKIAPGIRALGDVFGGAVAIDGDVLVVGATGEKEDASELVPLAYTGAAYIYRKDQGGANNWGQVKKIAPIFRAEGDQFGTSVDVSGNYVMVGAPLEDENENDQNYLGNAGAAYIFAKDEGGADNWGQARKITPPTRMSEAWFGSVVKISGDFAAAGSVYEPFDNQGQNYAYGAGSAYLFKRDLVNGGQWVQGGRLLPSSRATNDNFGRAMALSGTTLFVGALGNAGESAIANSGAVYVFRQDGAMPVNLAAFKAAKIENQAFLQWTTSAEANTSHFDIQKSANAKDWTTIGTREAAKESSALVHYNFWDTKLNAGANYYRLKMVDQDGTFAYSSIRNLSSEGGEELVAFPNPVVDRIYIKAGDFNRITSVQIRNAAGQLVFETAKVDGEGIPAGDLIAGIYNIHIRHTDGSAVTRKITIIR
ncbi:hypothetical protein GCM10010967_31040 [Dyadobacter beijingensis]|uniref:Secreted protein (Por secretion system target) n=2 Tax=Dyadobacter beijingensis TaxID=365489 RepID=A0ABQ2HZK7_9BACT|nr:hypothetical protein GCM10010967_31040 [Dyadobacter beijingensis]